MFLMDIFFCDHFGHKVSIILKSTGTFFIDAFILQKLYQKAIEIMALNAPIPYNLLTLFFSQGTGSLHTNFMSSTNSSHRLNGFCGNQNLLTIIIP